MPSSELRELGKEAAQKRILFLPHAVNQMNAPERMVSTLEVRAVIMHGVTIEEYPNDPREPGCLMLGWNLHTARAH
jgi:UV DNA damage repair endonuclease